MVCLCSSLPFIQKKGVVVAVKLSKPLAKSCKTMGRCKFVKTLSIMLTSVKILIISRIDCLITDPDWLFCLKSGGDRPGAVKLFANSFVDSSSRFRCFGGIFADLAGFLADPSHNFVNL